MGKVIISPTSYGGTGSSAISDIFKEFNCCLSLGEKELPFLYDLHGVSDLEYFLTDGNSRSKTPFAINQFIAYFKKNYSLYEKYFSPDFVKDLENYLSELNLTHFKKALLEFEVDSNLKRFLIFKLFAFLQIKIAGFYRNNINEYSPFFPQIKKSYTYLTREQFSYITKRFTGALISRLDDINKYEFILLDQLFPPINTNRYNNYIENVKTIIVDRDPRDVFLLNNIQWKGASYICDTKDVNEFIGWYRSMRLHRSANHIKDKSILEINFEDLIYDYDNTLSRICDFIGVNQESHTEKFKHFNPNISKRNTKLFEESNSFSKELIQIENSLGEFLYD